MAFIPNPNCKREVNHIDGNKLNNYVDNLEWCTQSENIQHAVATGLKAQGEEHGRAKLTNEQVEEIRANPYGLTLEKLAEKFGVSSVVHSRVLHTYGIGESQLETKIDDLILAQKNPTLALLIRPTGVIIRITAKAKNEAAAEKLIAPVEKEIRARLSKMRAVPFARRKSVHRTSLKKFALKFSLIGLLVIIANGNSLANTELAKRAFGISFTGVNVSCA